MDVTPEQDPSAVRSDTDALTPPRARFCTTCGTTLVEGRCPSCGPSASEAGPTDAGAGSSAVVRALLGLIAVVTAVALVVGIVHVRTRSLTDRTKELAQENRELEKAAAATQEQLDEALVRVGALESAAASQPDTAEVVSRVKSSVFTVFVGDSTGSAWVVGSDGTTSRLITNYHVISTAWNDGDRSVTLIDGELERTGVVIDVSQGTDVALIEVDAAFPVLERAPALPAVGAGVLAFGSPLGLDDSVSTGIISAIRREGVDDFIQFSAPVSPGSSGGPLVDQTGKVIGVTVAKAFGEGVEGLGFAIPIDLVCDVVAC